MIPFKIDHIVTSEGYPDVLPTITWAFYLTTVTFENQKLNYLEERKKKPNIIAFIDRGIQIER